MITFNWVLFVAPIILFLGVYSAIKYPKYRTIIMIITILIFIILSAINVDITGSQIQVRKESVIATQNFESSMLIPKEIVKEFNYTKDFNKIKSDFELEQKRIENEASKGY